MWEKVEKKIFLYSSGGYSDIDKGESSRVLQSEEDLGRGLGRERDDLNNNLRKNGRTT